MNNQKNPKNKIPIIVHLPEAWIYFLDCFLRVPNFPWANRSEVVLEALEIWLDKFTKEISKGAQKIPKELCPKELIDILDKEASREEEQ